MSDAPATTGGQRPPARRRTWTLDPGDPQTVLANARRALFVMAGVLALLWIIQIVNWALGYSLVHSYGIRPRDLGSLPYLLTAPFLHFSWTHIEGNSGPLFIFGFLAAYRGIGKFISVTAIVIVTSGLAAWLFQSPGVGAGASGVVFGYLGYVLVRGFFDRHGIDILIAAIMALCFAYQFTVLLPHQGVGWQAHIGGLIGGIAAGWLLRERRRAPVTAGAPAGRRAAATAKAAQRPVQPGKGTAPVDPSNPRAELYKQLDDLGL
ncbi:MAG: rhomboid family intramembrane serine protease [Streptosporangiaceae bacterium]